MSLVAKWGNSLAVRLPKSVERECQIREGDDVDVSVSQAGNIIIKPVGRKRRLQALLNSITPDTLHSESDWGPAVGNEIW